MNRLTLLLLFASSVFAYTDGTKLVLDVSKNQFTVNDSGSLMASYPLTCESNASEICKVRFYQGGSYTYVAGSDTACHDPCSVSFSTEYGQVSMIQEVWDSGNSVLLRTSSRLYVPFSQATATTGPWGVPVTVHGFKSYKPAPFQFSIAGGADFSGGLRFWIRSFNLRPGVGAIVTNNGIEHVFQVTHVTDLKANSGTCIGTTATPHDMRVTGNPDVQLNSFNNFQNGSSAQSGILNNFWTLSGVTPYTFTFTCAGVGNSNFHAATPVGMDMGATVSQTVYYSDEKKWYRGLDGLHQNFRMMIPLATGEFTAGTANQFSLEFKDVADTSLQGLSHGWYAEGFNLINGPDVPISQIVVGGSCTAGLACATTSSSIPASWTTGDTVVIQNAPGPQWRFNDLRTITVVDSTHFNFTWGPDVVNLAESGETAGSAPFTTTSGTYTVPTSRYVNTAPQPVMSAAHCLIPKSSFTAATLPSLSGNATNGQTVFTSTTLHDPNSAIPANASIATCQSSGCHTHSVLTVSDLKYFGFSEYVEAIAGMRRGLSESDAKDLAAFLSSNSVTRPTKGHPWNSPFQPGPGLDSNPVQNWAAGAGQEWELTYDNDIYEFLVPGGTPPSSGEWTGGSYSSWAQNANPAVNLRHLPMTVSMPSWLQWLPRTSPLDFFHYFLNADFTTNLADTKYQQWLTDFTQVTLTSGINGSVTSIPVSDASKIANNDYIQFASGEYAKVTAGGGTSGATSLTVTRAANPCTNCTSPAGASQSSGTFVSDFTKYIADGELVNNVAILSNGGLDIKAKYDPANQPGGAVSGNVWPSPYGPAFWDIYSWNMRVKWELTQTFWLQNMLDQTYIAYNQCAPSGGAPPQYTRGIFDQMTFNWGPHKSWTNETSGGHSTFYNTGPQGDANWGIDTAQKYFLASILDAGNGFRCCNFQSDDPYYSAFADVIAERRPSFYTRELLTAIQFQNAMGYGGLQFPYGAGCSNSGFAQVQNVRVDFPLSLQRSGNGGIDLFVTEARKAELFGEFASQLLTMLQTYSTGAWQTYITNRCGASCLTTVPNRTNGKAGTGNYQDSFGFGLAELSYYNTTFSLGIGTTISSIVTILDSIFTIPGHTFATDAAATCTLAGSPPQLSCP